MKYLASPTGDLPFQIVHERKASHAQAQAHLWIPLLKRERGSGAMGSGVFLGPLPVHDLQQHRRTHGQM
jgi:hypothetical protein